MRLFFALISCLLLLCSAAFVTESGDTDGPQNFLSRTVARFVKPNHRIASKISFAATNVASLYVNGRKVSSVRNWKVYRTVYGPLRNGDVVALTVDGPGDWAGAIADILLPQEKRHHVTGGPAWRGVKSFSDSEHAWMKPGYDACNWQFLSTVNPKDLFPGKAVRFPYRNGARYVWTKDSSDVDGIFMRFVVGGDDCVPGHSAVRGKPYCRCKILKGPGGLCYDFIKRFSSKGKLCDVRPCEPKYVCVTNGMRQGTKLCVRRLAKRRVVPTEHGFCSTVRIRNYFYSPYDA